MQITREQVQQFVHIHLREQAETFLLNKSPDEYYGWVPPVTESHVSPTLGETITVVSPGHWLGERDELIARQAVIDAERHLGVATAALTRAKYDYENADPEQVVFDAACTALTHAKAHLERTYLVSAYAIEKRRALVIERDAARLFKQHYRLAMTTTWDLYHAAISNDLRRYLKFWSKKRTTLSPSSVVYLYLVLLDTIQHGESFQTTAITGLNYLAQIPLVRSGLDVNACEDEPSLADRQYVNALQSELRIDMRPDAHENGDRRDARADFQYDGLPDQLGALWLDKNDGNECPTCGDKLTTKTVHSPRGYALAEVCPNHKSRAGCTHRPLTPRFDTKTQLRDHLCIEWALSKMPVAQPQPA